MHVECLDESYRTFWLFVDYAQRCIPRARACCLRHTPVVSIKQGGCFLLKKKGAAAVPSRSMTRYMGSSVIGRREFNDEAVLLILVGVFF